MPDDRSTASSIDRDLAGLRAEVERLRVENARLLRLLQLTPTQAQPPGPTQTAIFESAPGSVHAGSPPADKVAFYATLFAARTDAYAVRWDNTRSGKGGWMPAVRGGWRRGPRHPGALRRPVGITCPPSAGSRLARPSEWPAGSGRYRSAPEPSGYVPQRPPRSQCRFPARSTHTCAR